MQDRFTYDVGDFGKYGLLRRLVGTTAGDGRQLLRLGVCWYLVPDAIGDKAGKHTGYLDLVDDDNQYRRCDPDLYDALKRIKQGEERSVRRVMGSAILPENTVYYAERLTFAGIPPTKVNERLAHRSAWLGGSVKALQDADLVFLDPDIGLEVASKTRIRKSGPSYVFYDEVEPYLDRGQSVVVYDNLPYRGRGEDPQQIQNRLAEMSRRIQRFRHPSAMYFVRGTTRAFFILPTDAHRDLLWHRCCAMMKSSWRVHFPSLFDLRGEWRTSGNQE